MLSTSAAFAMSSFGGGAEEQVFRIPVANARQRFHAARQRQHFRLRFLAVQVPLLPFRLCLRAVPFAEAAAKAP